MKNQRQITEFTAEKLCCEAEKNYTDSLKYKKLQKFRPLNNTRSLKMQTCTPKEKKNQNNRDEI